MKDIVGELETGKIDPIIAKKQPAYNPVEGEHNLNLVKFKKFRQNIEMMMTQIKEK